MATAEAKAAKAFRKAAAQRPGLIIIDDPHAADPPAPAATEKPLGPVAAARARKATQTAQ